MESTELLTPEVPVAQPDARIMTDRLLSDTQRHEATLLRNAVLEVDHSRASTGLSLFQYVAVAVVGLVVTVGLLLILSRLL